MLLSVGSLLGQGLLDVLESRRAHVTVIGLNSVASSPGNFRTDRGYLTPPLAESSAFTARLLEVLALEQPDVILPGRDQDVVFLAGFRNSHPEHAQRIPCGSPEAACMISDKALCSDWAREQGLPFADSYLHRHGQPGLNTFLERVSFPLIAKPRRGFGSQGVFFVRTAAEIEQLLQTSDTSELLLQAYLGDARTLRPHFQRYDRGVPLFFQIPEQDQYSAQSLIRPDGSQGPTLCAVSTLILGRTERFCAQDNPPLTDLMARYALALADMGWRGSINLQAKPDQAGRWQAFELNLRMTGGTSSRLHYGFDEMGLLLQAFYPQFNFPVLTRRALPGAVFHRLQDSYVPDHWIETLTQTGSWNSAVSS